MLLDLLMFGFGIPQNYQIIINFALGKYYIAMKVDGKLEISNYEISIQVSI